MNKKNTEKLYKDFPKLYSHHKQPCRETCMCWGFSCGDGWFKLIYELSSTIQSYIDNNKAPQVVVVQVKEKYGGLRFYTQGEDRLIHGMIWFADSLSYSICEMCGSMKNVTQNKKGWISTLCKKCRREDDLIN